MKTIIFAGREFRCIESDVEIFKGEKVYSENGIEVKPWLFNGIKVEIDQECGEMEFIGALAKIDPDTQPVDIYYNQGKISYFGRGSVFNVDPCDGGSSATLNVVGSRKKGKTMLVLIEE